MFNKEYLDVGIIALSHIEHSIIHSVHVLLDTARVRDWNEYSC